MLQVLELCGVCFNIGYVTPSFQTVYVSTVVFLVLELCEVKLAKSFLIRFLDCSIFASYVRIRNRVLPKNIKKS